MLALCCSALVLLPTPYLERMQGNSSICMQEPAASSSAAASPMDDLLGGLDALTVNGNAAAHQAVPAAAPSGRATSDDPFGLGTLGESAAGAGSGAPAAPQLPLLIEAHGCRVCGDVIYDGMYMFRAAITNNSGGVMSGFHVQFNKNAAGVGVAVGATQLAVGPLNPGQTGHATKALEQMADKQDAAQGRVLQTALKWAELTAAKFITVQIELPQ